MLKFVIKGYIFVASLALLFFSNCSGVQLTEKKIQQIEANDHGYLVMSFPEDVFPDNKWSWDPANLLIMIDNKPYYRSNNLRKHSTFLYRQAGMRLPF